MKFDVVSAVMRFVDFEASWRLLFTHPAHHAMVIYASVAATGFSAMPSAPFVCALKRRLTTELRTTVVVMSSLSGLPSTIRLRTPRRAGWQQLLLRPSVPVPFLVAGGADMGDRRRNDGKGGSAGSGTGGGGYYGNDGGNGDPQLAWARRGDGHYVEGLLQQEGLFQQEWEWHGHYDGTASTRAQGSRRGGGS